MSERLETYCRRIGLGHVPSSDPVGITRLVEAHRQAIPFENLDILLGRGIAIGSDAVFAKFTGQRRGGYCFEQNRLLSDMLHDMSIANRPLLGRVRLGLGADDPVPVRSHVLLLADIGGREWIVDGGFGGSFLPPIPLTEGSEIPSNDGAAHRLRKQGGGLNGEWLLERAGPVAATDGRPAPHEGWQAQYTFDLAPVAAADLEQANHWTATRPDTRFTTLQVVSIALPDGFASLTDRIFTRHSDGHSERREIGDAAEYRDVLQTLFKLDLNEQEIRSLPLFRQE
ncbi:arylamine N-acetyltransferase family protein [Altericroceibacterium endophyticum]|uniref:Arylamine N-acetyltransferase n=1 Tax=Altericroceibacterium endophyticum TaxID=1808508 RepID=A0A6I4T6X9_9SPHN|nr:arylamine N-acetyltransferase [Altericroceibacterium endophyticum]MXO65763.1 arylamine N-acetyltransferase [Altericroceibacterium endophyticum]